MAVRHAPMEAVLTQEDPLYRRIRQHAERRIKLPVHADQAELLAAYRDFLRLEDQMLLRYHRKGDGGARVARARAMVFDVIIERLYNRVVSRFEQDRGHPPVEVAVVALGGYGRSEMAPFSDIDLMFLFPASARKPELETLQQALTHTILYLFWDLRLKVGHSTRTEREALDEARKDIQTRNSLLEARFLVGSQKLYQRFRRNLDHYLRRSNLRLYIEERFKDQEERRARYGGTVFVQEPDIKNGVGGLRDLHNMRWLLQMRFADGGLREAVRRELLSASEVTAVEEAFDFLLRVRNELHFQNERPTDTLALDKQPRVAWELGYREHDIFERVERFMRDYYRRARAIQKASLALEQQLLRSQHTRPTFRAVIEARSAGNGKRLDGFEVREGRLMATSADVFEEDPERLIRVFRHSQELGVEIDFETTRLIETSSNLITPQMHQSASANRSFRSILQSVGQVYPALRSMHDLGVLGRFLPEFDRLSCLVQHEFYHRYTADFHTLSTILELDRIFNRESRDRAAYHRAIHQTPTPSLLYLILLLHDIGKGYGIKGHAERGRELAVPILERLGVKEGFRDDVLFIISQHLEMARFWQRFDVYDPQSIEAFADRIGQPNRLRLLYVHTLCDARGTAEGLWTSYKDMLHTQLYQNTLRYLEEGAVPALSAERRKRMTNERISGDGTPGITQEEIDAHYSLLPERYFLHATRDEILLHLRMVHELLERIATAESVASLVPVVDWQDNLDLSMTVVNVVTWDRPGLFNKLAGAFTVAGVNILSSRAITRSDHILIDTFYVCAPGGGVVQRTAAKTAFQDALRRALIENRDLTPDIEALARKQAKPSYLTRDTRLAAPIPASVDVYHELSLKRTIIEVQANDEAGLLYQISKTIFEHGFDITFARIATERSVAMDTFYIEPIGPQDEGSGTNTANLMELREALNQIVIHAHENAVGE